MLKLSRVMVAILNFRSANDSQPPNDHSCKVTIQLAWWFLTRRFLKFRPIKTHYGPWQPCWISDQRQKQKLVYDHPMNISAKFGSNLFCGFRKKDENVKFP
jgi:hypothetical protein